MQGFFSPLNSSLEVFNFTNDLQQILFYTKIVFTLGPFRMALRHTLFLEGHALFLCAMPLFWPIIAFFLYKNGPFSWCESPFSFVTLEVQILERFDQYVAWLHKKFVLRTVFMHLTSWHCNHTEYTITVFKVLLFYQTFVVLLTWPLSR